MKKLTLKEVIGYSLTVPVDERRTRVAGYYKDSKIARMDAEGAGWYGSNGSVNEEVIYEDEGGKPYIVKPIGEYVDVSRNKKEEIMKKIKSKLSKEEIEFLGIKDEI